MQAVFFIIIFYLSEKCCLAPFHPAESLPVGYTLGAVGKHKQKFNSIHLWPSIFCYLCFSPFFLLRVIINFSLSSLEKLPEFVGLKTHFFVHSGEPQRAVHLGLTAGWCQDWSWPKACRTESSSERSALRVFPSCASVTSSCRREPRGAIWGGLGPEHKGLSTENSN